MKIRAFAAIFSLFLFVLPIPGTIALRNTLMLLLLGLLVPLWRQCNFTVYLRESNVRGLFFWAGILTAWLFLQAGLISEESSWAFREISGQWLSAMLSIPVGIGVVLVARHQNISRQKLLAGLMLIFLAQTLFSLLVTLPDFLATGIFPQSKTLLTAGKLEISYWNNLILAFLAVDGLSRWLYDRPISALPRSVLFGGIVLVLASNLAFGARNGIIGSMLLLFSLVVLVLWRERRRIGIKKVFGFVLSAILLTIFLAWFNYQNDTRWKYFGETASLAWSGKSDVWRNPNGATYPKLPSGEPVEASAYMRIAWIKAGLSLIVDYPLGVGYGRNAFGHALRKTAPSTLGHAHSGLIDWTVGTGVPGLVLWLSFLGWLGWLGVRRYFSGRDPAGLILVFVVGGYLGRMFLDSVNRDHMLIVFFLTLAVLVTLPEEPVSQ